MIIEQPAPHAYSEASSDIASSPGTWQQGWVHGCGRDARVGDAGGQCWEDPVSPCPGLELGALVTRPCCSTRAVAVV